MKMYQLLTITVAMLGLAMILKATKSSTLPVPCYQEAPKIATPFPYTASFTIPQFPEDGQQHHGASRF